MTTSIIVDYKILYFQVPNLARVHGEPTYPQLQLLFNKIKANESQVKNDLGGGIHDHTGIVLRPEDYKEVSPVKPYEKPFMPAPLRIPSNTTMHENQRLQEYFSKTCQL